MMRRPFGDVYGRLTFVNTHTLVNADIARLVDTAHDLTASHFDNASFTDYFAEQEAEICRVIEHGR